MRATRDTNAELLSLFLSITCAEDVAFVREQDVAAATQATFLGDYRLRQQQAACREWPSATLPKDYREPVHSEVPTLFVSGDADGATPLWYAEHVAAGFPNHVRLVARGQGHTEWSECIAQLYERLNFATAASAGRLFLRSRTASIVQNQLGRYL